MTMTRSSTRTTATSTIIRLFLSLLLSLLLLSATSLPISFSDGKNHTITQNYTDTNVFLRNGTTVTLTAHSVISAPASSADAEEAVRVENAVFLGQGGVIVGGEGVGGAGVTVTTDKERDRVSRATFEEGIQVYGGGAGRESTTRGGNAVQILQVGAEVSFHEGTFVPGTGCTREVCGVQTDDGNSIQILYGKAIVKGGSFLGNIYSVSGVVEVHGCVEFDGERIHGVLLDGSRMDVGYVGDENDLSIVYDDAVCQEDLAGVEEESLDSSNSRSSGAGLVNFLDRLRMMSLSLGSLSLVILPLWQ